ncbi:MAG TPA: hypothetical protein VEX67_19745 [Solirubrobacteraceae bacterium]|nr:hypothetical protein [Solirubrobacteraceae bacterium]
MAAVADTEDQLRWEQRQGFPAAMAALAAALLSFVGLVWREIALSDMPRTSYLASLDAASQPGALGGQTSQAVAHWEFYDDRALVVLGATFVIALGYVAMGWALAYLGVATRARRPEMPKLFVYLPIVAGILQALSAIVFTIALNQSVSDFLSGDRTVDQAVDIGTNGTAVFAQVLGLPGALGLALSVVLISLNAMRIGLLTRFLGVLGMIVGALLVLQLPVATIVLAFWFVMLSVLFMGKWPQQPPAWVSGKPEPWPTSADLRAQRQKALAAERGEPEPEPEPEPVAAGGASPSASAAKRKRKRR